MYTTDAQRKPIVRISNIIVIIIIFFVLPGPDTIETRIKRPDAPRKSIDIKLNDKWILASLDGSSLYFQYGDKIKPTPNVQIANIIVIKKHNNRKIDMICMYVLFLLRNNIEQNEKN